MGITVGAALKKVAAAILTEPKVLKNILFAILVVLVALLLPMVMVVCLFSGRFQVDTAELQRHVEANLTAADVQLLRSVEDTMAEIEFAMILFRMAAVSPSTWRPMIWGVASSTVTERPERISRRR